MPFIDRDDFIRLLDSLGDEDDATVLAAAREIDRRVREAEIAWADLLAPEDDDELDDEFDDGYDDELDDDLDDALSDGDEDGAALADGSDPESDDADDAALIDRLLAKPDLASQTREELEDLKEDLADGEFTAMDRRYLKALQKRLFTKS